IRRGAHLGLVGALQAILNGAQQPAPDERALPRRLPERGREFPGLHTLLEVAQVFAEQQHRIVSPELRDGALDDVALGVDFPHHAQLGASIGRAGGDFRDAATPGFVAHASEPLDAAGRIQTDDLDVWARDAFGLLRLVAESARKVAQDPRDFFRVLPRGEHVAGRSLNRHGMRELLAVGPVHETYLGFDRSPTIDAATGPDSAGA